MSEYLLKTKGIKVIDEYSHINGYTSSTNIFTTEISEDIKEFILKLKILEILQIRKYFQNIFSNYY